jgi:hypothetical protein
LRKQYVLSTIPQQNFPRADWCGVFFRTFDGNNASKSFQLSFSTGFYSYAFLFTHIVDLFNNRENNILPKWAGKENAGWQRCSF